jgi:methionyl-tRNA formyltransferase
LALSENTDRSKEVCLAKLIFLGSPSAAVPSLDALVGAGHEVVLVVTREDKRRGRGNVPAPTPVKERAVELGLPVSHRLEDVLDVQADLGVVVAYGRIIPAALLQRLLFLNVHFSLLPRWRGAAPVERAILAGDRSSGVCIMRLAEGLDTGPLYACVEIAVDDDETCFALTDRLAHLGADLLTRLLSGNVAGLPEPVEQQGEPVYARKLEPGDLKIDWRSQSIAICRQVRLEKAWTTFRGRRIIIKEVEAVSHGNRAGSERSLGDRIPAGWASASRLSTGFTGDSRGVPEQSGLLEVRNGVPVVATGDGELVLKTVRPEGRRETSGKDWVRGARISGQERFGG